MAIAKDKKGQNTLQRDALVLGLREVAEALRVPEATVLSLWSRGLFPAPCHTLPPLWEETVVQRWVEAAAGVPTT